MLYCVQRLFSVLIWVEQNVSQTDISHVIKILFPVKKIVKNKQISTFFILFVYLFKTSTKKKLGLSLLRLSPEYVMMHEKFIKKYIIILLLTF